MSVSTEQCFAHTKGVTKMDVERRDDGFVQYCGEEQAICAVGLVQPRPGVFIEAIQYLLVVATPVEVVKLMTQMVDPYPSFVGIIHTL